MSDRQPLARGAGARRSPVQGPLARFSAFLAVVAAAVAISAGCKGPPSRKKTDIVQLTNGDRITGEVRKLEQGKLTLKTTALDTVYVEWDKVAQLMSVYGFEYEDTNGVRHFGRLTQEAPGSVTIVDEDGSSATLRLVDIVEITPIDESFLSRLDGSVGLGFNYNKGSDVGQVVADANVEYRTRKVRNELDFSSTISRDSDEEQTSRNTLSLGLNRYLQRWFGFATASLETNEALGLDLRTSIDGGVGHSLISSSSNLLELGVGLALSEENSTGSSSGSSVLEGVLRATYSIFRFTDREVDSDFELAVYPGITESGRVRGELDANVRRELAKNFYLELSGYYSYDNEPPAGAEDSDFGINTSLGWSF